VSDTWYTRPVLCVFDVECSLGFYVDKLGFAEAWRHAEDGQTLVAQVDRSGCELILSSQWPEKVGTALIFISLDAQVLAAARAEFESRGVAVKDGWWGYKLMTVEDPDGNQLYFPYPKDEQE
jgi:catechol 2,3-dioxygenase-like lactoylglutathione lyase family enzyme